jgi:hypothetical protein
VDDKRFRFDLFIALCALLISTVAAGASAYQTYVINQQFSATVWPYLSFSTDSDKHQRFWELDLRNDGLGPALIRNATVTLDGKPVGLGSDNNPLDETFRPALDAAIVEERRNHQHDIHTTSSSLGAGDVIPAGTKVTMLRIEGPPLVRRVAKIVPHVDVAFCYCSLLGQCWTRSLGDDQPQSARSCPKSG